MLDRLHEYVRCFADPQRWAIASVVSVTGSSPVPVGTSMAVSDDLEIIGALSAGCAETAAALSAQQAIERDEAVVEVFSRDGERVSSVNLTCGGAMEVLILPLSRMQDLERARQLTHQDRRHRASLSIDVAELAATVRFARSAAPTLILTGVHDFSQQLAEAAVRAAGGPTLWTSGANSPSRTVPARRTAARGAPSLRRQRPHLSGRLPFTAVCVMTHHPDLDVPVLSEALRSPGVSFVGAMGSRFAAARRDMELAELGHPAASRGRVRSPLGLDIGSQSPAESAISMFAEILGAKNDASDHLGRPCR
ncbi:XdhC family protein [Nesterenkonia pannonica]|uniref:XdhC family protein n=1 Tax=Nesterenkonia pannonica TaxID=1548602 RepID=UPI002164E3B1|nr:XdhC family protein [Nesterenkonia pannonica]